MKKIGIKKWKYLFWLGPFLAVMGTSAAVVSGSWGAIPLGLLISGIVLLGAWLLFQANQTVWWRRRSTQAGTNAVVATLSLLAILALLNFLSTRYPWRLDLTETQLFTLAPASQEVVRHLQQPVEVVIFSRNQNPEDVELLHNYERQGSKFSFEYIDPQAQPTLAQKFGVKEAGAVYLKQGAQQKFVQVVNEQQHLSETALTNALAQIQNSQVNKVYFLQGHGEHPLTATPGGISQAINSLKDKNFIPAPLNLTQQSVPQDAKVIVVAGPKRALFDKEVQALSNYLNSGGSLLLLIDPNTNPNLNFLLKVWGIRLENSLVIDVSGKSIGFGPAVPLVTQYGNSPITQDFGNGISFYPLARPIELNSVPGVQATAILLTNPYPQSWAHGKFNNQDLKFDPKNDRPGPLILGVAATRQVQPNKQARLVTIGNSDFATDGRFDQQLNGDVFLNSVSWLTKQDEQLISVRPKQEKNRSINMPQTDARILGWTILLFPLIGFGIAILLWWKRR